MDSLTKAVVLDDETVIISGRRLVEKDEITDVLESVFQSNPNCILVIEPNKNEFYRGTRKVIYASQCVGIPVENLRYTTETGEVVTFDELQTRNPTRSA